jgi:hypothetical protein
MKLMNHIVEGLGVISVASGGDSPRVAIIKARLFMNSFTRMETKTKIMQPWLHQVEAYMETKYVKKDKE